GNGNVLNKYADGSSAEFQGENIIKQTTADGVVYTEFDENDNPHKGFADGHSFDIEYLGNGNVLNKYHDGSTAEFAGERPIRQTTADGTVYTQFDEEKRPVGGTTAENQPISIKYSEDGGRVVDVAGNLTYIDKFDKPYLMTTTDGSEYTEFYDDGRAKNGKTEDELPIHIDYTDDGGRVVNIGGNVTHVDRFDKPFLLTTTDGSSFTEFYDDGKPKNGKTDDELPIHIDYTDDGGRVVNVGGNVTHVDRFDKPFLLTTTDGSSFTEFYDNGKPKNGKTSDNLPIHIDYTDDGGRVVNVGGNVTHIDRFDKPFLMTTTDGSTFTEFYDDGKPKNGTTEDNLPIHIDYTGDGGRIVTVDGNALHLDKNNVPFLLETKDGSKFEDFYPDGRPENGFTSEGKPIHIDYFGNGSRTVTVDGNEMYLDADNKPYYLGMTNGSWFYDFDAKGRPTRGFTPDGKPITIVYDDVTGGKTIYADGVTITYDKYNDPIEMRTTDGSIYTAFNADGKPTRGTKDGKDITITYNPDGSVKVEYDGQYTVYDANNQIIETGTWNKDKNQWESVNWSAEMPLLAEAARQTRNEALILTLGAAVVDYLLEQARDHWDSPAGDAYNDYRRTFSSAANQMIELLNEAAKRMQMTYDNYYNAEETNTNNLGLPAMTRPPEGLEHAPTYGEPLRATLVERLPAAKL
ncbi:WXG100 family type VII secretion target, partial [Virgisporangium aliadipatigenens]|uniref:WXG100 family type VII secretion target n=1 Tax=Virgisporangium aliadipatigenens TaxID=741659 RepID=UPI001941AB41